MNLEETVVVVLGLALGFLVVWYVMGAMTAKPRPSAVPTSSTVLPEIDVPGVDAASPVPAQAMPPPMPASAQLSAPVATYADPGGAAWRSVLGVGPAAGMLEAELAYEAARSKYDPARLQDMAPELRQLAEQRIAEIERAMAQARAEFGRPA